MIYVVGGVAFFFLALVVFLIVVPIQYDSVGEGEHNGYITAIEQKGIFYRNWHVYVKTDNSSSQEDSYCVPESEKELVKQAKQANKARKQVIVHFKGVRGIGYGLCDFAQITSIE